MNEFDRLASKVGNFNVFVTEVGNLIPDWDDVKRSDGRISRELQKFMNDNDEIKATDRFIISFCGRFSFGRSIFRLFTPSEVFERLQMVEPRTTVRVTTEDRGGSIYALAASNPARAIVDYDDLFSILEKRKKNIDKISYNNGVIEVTFSMDEAPWSVNGDVFEQAFTAQIPIDGYGLPLIYLALKRTASNSTIVFTSPAFKSEVQLGKLNDKPIIPLTRSLDTFNNEEGFQAIRQRLDAAQKSTASLHETGSLYKRLNRVVTSSANSKLWAPIFKSYMDMTGDVTRIYGIATDEAISAKKARLLPMHCTVADLINFASEVVSHHSNVLHNSNTIFSWIGETISNEYDLENSLEDATTPTATWIKMEEKND